MFAKAVSSLMAGQPELFVSDSVLKAWCVKYGYLNSADLVSVMNTMQKQGITFNGVLYTDGPHTVVDYSTDSNLQSAISTGPVKLGIDANALPSTAGNAQGWHAIGGKPGQFNNEDHCVSLCGFGTADYLYKQLNVPLPAGISATQNGYLLYTWSTIGFVDHDWIMSTVGEAWVRTPTTPQFTPNPIPDPTIIGYTAPYSGTTGAGKTFNIPSLPVYQQKPAAGK